MASKHIRRGELLAFARRVLVATLVVVSVLLLLLLIWYAADLLMLVFAGVLISILLRTFTEFLVKHTRLGYVISLALVALGLVVLVVAISWLVLDRIIDQMKQLQVLLPILGSMSGAEMRLIVCRTLMTGLLSAAVRSYRN
jgi:predicted PurR-regulated permease PerM